MGTANRTLNAFGETPQAWEVCRSILADTTQPAPLLFYAAATLRRKLERGHLAQLPRGAPQALRGMLLSWTVDVAARVDAAGADPALLSVLRCLAAAVAAFCAQVPQQVWRTPVDDVLALSGRTGSTTAVFALLESLPAAVSPRTVILASAGVVQNRARLSAMFSARFRDVCAVLAHVLAHRGSSDAAVANTVFGCYSSWLAAVPAAPGVIAAAELPSAAFDALKYPQLTEAAAESVCGLVHASTRQEGAAGLSLRVSVLQRLDACRGMLCGTTHPLVLRSLARILAEIGECYVFELVSGSLPTGIVASLTLLFLQCGVHRDTLALALQAFHSMCQCVTANRFTAVQRAPLQCAFQNVIQPISVCALRLLQLPEQFENESVTSSEEHDAIKDFRRHDVAELMRDCTTIVGCDVMTSALLQKLDAEVKRSQWRCVESVLFGLRAVARCADIRSSAITPVFDCIMKLPRHDLLLQSTALLTVGRYADWLACVPDEVIPVLSYVVSFLQERRLQSVAALSFQRICLACPAHLAGYATHFLRVYQSCCGEWNIAESECDQVINGFGCVFRHVPTTTLDSLVSTLRVFARDDIAAVNAFKAALQPSTPHQSLQSPWAKQLASCFRRLGTLIRSFLPQRGEETYVSKCGGEDPRAALVREWWKELALPFLSSFSSLPRDVVEQLCRFCRKALLSCQPSLQVVLPEICDQLIAIFSRPGQQHPALLSILSCVVRAYSRAGSAVPSDVQGVLLQALLSMSMAALPCIESACTGAMVDEADLMKEFLELFACSMSVFPDAFFCAACAQDSVTSQLLSLVQRIVAFVPHALVDSPEQTAVAMALMFLERLFLLCSCPSYSSSLAALMSSSGVPLVRALLLCSVMQPESVLANVCSVLLAMKRFDAESLVAWLSAALQIDIPPEFAFVFPASCPADTGARPLPFRVTAQACTEFVVNFCRTGGSDRNSSARLLRVLEFFVGECRKY